MKKPQKNAKTNTREVVSTNPLLGEERKLKILEELQHKGKVTVAHLSQSLDVSEDTVRRDLRDLAKANKLKKVHGGAMPLTPIIQPYTTRTLQDQDLKQKLAKVSATLAQDKQVILIDSGTTCLAIAQNLSIDLQATVITPSPHVAIALAGHKNIKLILIGGTVNTEDMTVVGSTAFHSIKQIKTDLCFLGVCSIHTSIGVTTTDYEQAQLKSIMIENAAKTVATTTADKLDTASAFHIADTPALNYIVTDATNSTDATGGLEPYQQLGIQIVEV